MNVFRFTAVLGVFALASSAAQAQGLISQLFNSPATMFNQTTTTSCRTGTQCGPNGCSIPGQNPGAVPPGSLNTWTAPNPYFQNGPANGGYNFPGNNLPGSNSYGTARPNYNRTFPMYDANRGTIPFASRTPRVFTPQSQNYDYRFNEYQIPQRNNDNLQLQFSRPMFTGVSTSPNRPINSLPSMSGWNLQ